MRNSSAPFGVASATEIYRRATSRPDEIVGPTKFGRIAKIIWPFKTAQCLADIGRTTTRSAERWLSGEHEPPASVVAALLVEVLKRD
jgi:hypothetical protein